MPPSPIFPSRKDGKTFMSCTTFPSRQLGFYPRAESVVGDVGDDYVISATSGTGGRIPLALPRERENGERVE
ncbi:hypothetical protein GWI33_003333 [Rhynchophorus ferrugineus]|uniref:Uncharacterized protein n=1 Tax=Rhynchophorus ferrugineus TaxID=354439 RepID=A0A834IQZ6_RHYFE|nr:hypothetical protein GWI33_003333 [Rhynchophorus ferrugineus]